mmetsp:Transcript_46188/g.75372  ORF Transcript_46188/g.75372 Transcript_46188/m.75372 type:complete len:244 (+) Transcript_46188:373-1104(+)|eukprot:CAMPEP_0184654730 /NCGR_PEP_ID=MMETSP0308-20130426/12385_1 /TAXON_ID=38269 /ORGANISM="Gloeochaete witrockiana, Strain SAG 46.84" /LENGTH=243 /DNA_ID=CAMNT_0027090849 /DNA_START=362 /DNA_END=1093 /DNA_ORIENTATION=+
MSTCLCEAPAPVASLPKDLCEMHSHDSGCDCQQSGSETISPPKTVIVFDWDDTLLASTFLTNAGLKVDEPFELTGSLKTDLLELESSVITLLSLAANHGSIVIITNAETGWVELSASRFLPRVLPYLKDIRVISARSTFEAAYPNSPAEWKLQAFTEEVKRCSDSFKCEPSNVLSVGDSHTEREAVHSVGRTLNNAKIKSVKFIERPTLEQLRKQCELVASNLPQICAYDGHLDLLLTTPMVH